jgi:hypothetical protein
MLSVRAGDEAEVAYCGIGREVCCSAGALISGIGYLDIMDNQDSDLVLLFGNDLWCLSTGL